ncbi:MAG TPA: SUMF1/EgtB/PvdO family nonheme iron enzyme [Labilithrix sp.]|jgi:formylglycine-generating enzyme required for sulfatase activity
MKRGFVAVALALAAFGACKSQERVAGEPDADAGASPRASASTASADVVARPGMAWIPAGTLKAGTPKNRAPRVPDEEMPGDPVEMGGYYIDLLPYPNEPGAIPTSNVTREEAEQLCTSKNKRLCTELEWERACKGPESTTYEYGDTYRAGACGTGVSAEEGARRPTGEHPQCKSVFGASDMHGGTWEWTASSWGRASKDSSLAVLRGGNSAAGELVGRCANAIARSPSKKSPTWGFRCCQGPKNAAEVSITLENKPGLASRDPASMRPTWNPPVEAAVGAGARILRAWQWTPVANEELTILVTCILQVSCSVVVGRSQDGKPEVLAASDAGWEDPLPDVARIGDARHLRLKALDRHGVFGREITYVYGLVEIADPKRK